LEHFCLLMRTIGKLIDTPKAETLIRNYFTLMDGLITNKEIPTRVKFLLQDIVELRKRDWVPRRETTEAKTITEAHSDMGKDKHKTTAVEKNRS